MPGRSWGLLDWFHAGGQISWLATIGYVYTHFLANTIGSLTIQIFNRVRSRSPLFIRHRSV